MAVWLEPSPFGTTPQKVGLRLTLRVGSYRYASSGDGAGETGGWEQGPEPRCKSARRDGEYNGNSRHRLSIDIGKFDKHRRAGVGSVRVRCNDFTLTGQNGQRARPGG